MCPPAGFYGFVFIMFISILGFYESDLLLVAPFRVWRLIFSSVARPFCVLPPPPTPPDMHCCCHSNKGNKSHYIVLQGIIVGIFYCISIIRVWPPERMSPCVWVCEYVSMSFALNGWWKKKKLESQPPTPPQPLRTTHSAGFPSSQAHKIQFNYKWMNAMPWHSAHWEK